MTKSKRQPKNFFRYMLDEFILFRRDFYFEIEAEPEQVLQKLRATYHGNEGWTWHGKQIVHTISENSNGWLFEITLEEKTKGGDYESRSVANGTFQVQNGICYLEGHLSIDKEQISGLYMALACLSIFFLFLLVLNNMEFTGRLRIFLTAIPVVLIGSLISLWFDRYRLYKRIKKALDSLHEYPYKAKAS